MKLQGYDLYYYQTLCIIKNICEVVNSDKVMVITVAERWSISFEQNIYLSHFKYIKFQSNS